MDGESPAGAGGDADDSGTVTLPVVGEVSTLAVVLGAVAVVVFAVPVVVAVVVVLAAVLGTFVLGLGGGAEAAVPQAAFDFESDGSQVVVGHAGGARFDGENTRRLTVEDGSGATLARASLPFGAGDELTVDGVESGDVLRVVWYGPDGETGPQTLARYTVP